MTALGGVEVKVDAWQIDVVYAGSQTTSAATTPKPNSRTATAWAGWLGMLDLECPSSQPTVS
jgi:hypothetical protein